MSPDGAARDITDPAGVLPFHLRGSRPPACLLIHGFTGTPFETRGLGEHLNRRGHAALGLCLPGHGDGPAALEAAGWREWYRDVETNARQLVAEHGPIVAIGISAGALLALHLGHERPGDVRGLVLMAPALALRDWRVRWAAPYLARVPWFRDRFRFIPKTNGSDISDEGARQAHPGHRVVPLRAVLSLLELQRLVRGELGTIRQPSLLIHGALDRTCPVSNIEILRRRLGSPPRRVLILPESAHVVTVDREHDRVFEEAAAFVGELG